VDLADFDYALPPGAIAQRPAPPRDASRLLVIDRARETIADHMFAELPRFLRRGDCVVVNNSRVIPARVLAEDSRHRPVELLFLDGGDDVLGRALVRPGRHCGVGRELTTRSGAARLRVTGIEGDGTRIIERVGGTIASLLAAEGVPPLPPYITRHSAPDADDWERYQTVYAAIPGSIAAPTAGLHFTPSLLDDLRARGTEVHAVTLHVGVATFRPIRGNTLNGYLVPPERATILPSVAAAVNAARAEDRRVVAIGTTTARALEGAVGSDGGVEPLDRSVTLTIVPGFRFRVVGALVTNFHLPRSSLLLLAAAFAGRHLVLAAYRHAIEAGYRFYSYGDATLMV